MFYRAQNSGNSYSFSAAEAVSGQENKIVLRGWYFLLRDEQGGLLYRSARVERTMEHAGWLAYMLWKMAFAASYPEAVIEVDYTEDYLADGLRVLKCTGALP